MSAVKSRVGEIPEKKIKIDAKDKKILSILSEDSRVSLTQLAKKVALSRDAVNYRIKRLHDKGVIIRFFPEIDFEKLGYTMFNVFLLVDETDSERKEELITYLKKHDCVVNFIEYSDRWDFRVTFLAKDLKEFDKLLTEFLSNFSDIILAKENNAVVNEYYSTFLPESFKTITLDKKPKPFEDVKLDKKDMQILRCIARDCRQSTYDIARNVKLSPDAIGYRIKKIISSGIIKRFTTLINLSKLGYSWYTFGIQMKMFDANEESKFKEFVNGNPAILKAIKTMGTWDLMVFIVSDTSKNFHETIKDIKNTFSTSISNYESWIAYKEHYYQNFPKVLEDAHENM